MARIRTIKPEFYRHEKLQDIEVAHPGSYAMLVFSALWGHCDSKGRFEWRPRQLKLDILPFLPFDMAETLQVLADGGMIFYYEVDGKSYGKISSFEKHQRISGKELNDGERYPDLDREVVGKQQGSNGEQPESQEGKGREGNRKGEKEGNVCVSHAQESKLSEDEIQIIEYHKHVCGQIAPPPLASIRRWLQSGETVETITAAYDKASTYDQRLRGQMVARFLDDPKTKAVEKDLAAMDNFMALCKAAT